MWKPPSVLEHMYLEQHSFLNLANNKLNPVQKLLLTEVIFPSVPWIGSGNSTDNLVCGLQSLIARSSIRETELLVFGAVVKLGYSNVG